MAETNQHDALRSVEAALDLAERRLREAIDVMPEGVVFLDSDGRYILWNQKYSEIYAKSADLLQPGVRLADTLRIGIERGDYPEASGREDEWLADRLSLLENPGMRHEQLLSNGRTIMIEERKTMDGGTIGLRVDITEMKEREKSFRILFEDTRFPYWSTIPRRRSSEGPMMPQRNTLDLQRPIWRACQLKSCSRMTNGPKPAPC